MIVAEYLFWGSLSLVAYTYVGYPVLVWLFSRFAPETGSSRQKAEGSRQSRDRRLSFGPRLSTLDSQLSVPMVSLIIAAYREESVILERLQNALELDYPAERLEVLVGCDGNEDLTGELVSTFGDSRVRLLQFPKRRGKACVLNDCVREAVGDVLVFSDANTMMDRSALRTLVRHFSDASVGGVCGRLVLSDPETGNNADSLYWRYETFLKRCEARCGALVGANGAIHAIRRNIYRPLPAGATNDDMLIGMQVHEQGYRLPFEEKAIAREETSIGIGSEFGRRTRIGAGAFQSLRWLWPLLNPLRGRIAFAFWSHKLLRWLGPAFLIVAMVANIVLVRRPFYLQLLLWHEFFYLAAATGLWCLQNSPHLRLLRLPAMFVGMNAALLVGFWQWLSGRHRGLWNRSERQPTGGQAK